MVRMRSIQHILTAMSYVNPIIPGFNPDPSIVRVDKDFFLVTSSFEYFPGVPIYHSQDLIQWKLIGHALTRTSQLQIHTPEPGGGVWATTIRYHGGVYYIIAASFQRYRPQQDDRVWPQGFYVKTTDIWNEKTWSDPVYFDQVGFDQDLFWDDDGTVYLSSTYRKIQPTIGAKLKDFAIHICTVDLATGHSTSAPKLIRESSSGVAEGSHIFKRGRYWYLFTAEGGTESGHCEWVNRSEVSPLGPWELGPNNPLWRNGVDDEVQNTGHADLVEDTKGQWWAVVLGVRPSRRGDTWEDSVLGRETFLVPLEWKDDWPVINGGQKISLNSHGPGLYEFHTPVFWRDEFSDSQMQVGWYRKNTPFVTDYSLTERPNYLRLHGGPYNLSVPASPTMFLRKQTHHFCRWETRLSFEPTAAETEAGTVVWLNYFTYSSIGIRKDGKGRFIRFRPSKGDTVERRLDTKTAVTLTVDCGTEYRFGYREGTQPDVQWIGSVSNNTATAAPPVGANFTGMMLGLYAFGERQRCLAPADFAMSETLKADHLIPISDDAEQMTDDWSGLSDPTERRRRQNRINQRAYRKRKRLSSTKDVHPKSLVPPPRSTSTVQSQDRSSQDNPKVNFCRNPELSQDLLRRFAKSAYESYARGDPTADHLMTLTKVNVFRAFAQNLRLIGWSEYWMDDDAISLFNTALPPRPPRPDDNSLIPANLQPTRIQKSIPHHPWLDFFPFPKMRDNLIEAGDDWDDEQLCHDIMGFWGESTMDAGMLVWGEPWNVQNWEVTEPFLKKWQWVVRGCPELMDATNSWRARRGERLIFRYI
ncbi:Concanavalin A-like lectin/glucanase subgroup [Penicillium mononematosum]|uniref:Concanavalin A-like lectin/glucanase subgroup n=1 Tax=Penicillium mononematosum TaxID=268346 RepID=UPI002548CF7A|nr:Concanavalin A-like lectin/glucanase subgroup [Penicillium mononematosum]KAJ6179016.1 Concanavalin A-like lectin/glucanase subgroup [Penicillium mononematosum]